MKEMYCSIKGAPMGGVASAPTGWVKQIWGSFSLAILDTKSIYFSGLFSYSGIF